jgi:hypothetical protein
MAKKVTVAAHTRSAPKHNQPAAVPAAWSGIGPSSAPGNVSVPTGKGAFRGTAGSTSATGDVTDGQRKTDFDDDSNADTGVTDDYLDKHARAFEKQVMKKYPGKKKGGY